MATKRNATPRKALREAIADLDPEDREEAQEDVEDAEDAARRVLRRGGTVAQARRAARKEAAGSPIPANVLVAGVLDDIKRRDPDLFDGEDPDKDDPDKDKDDPDKDDPDKDDPDKDDPDKDDPDKDKDPPDDKDKVKPVPGHRWFR